jgi:hypothetical protein
VTQKWDFRADPVSDGARAQKGKERGKIVPLCARSR